MSEKSSEEPKKKTVKRKYTKFNVDTGKFAGQVVRKISTDQPPSIDEHPPQGYEIKKGKLKPEGESDMLPGVDLEETKRKYNEAGSPMKGAKDD